MLLIYKIIKLLLLFASVITITAGDNCSRDPVILDEEFAGCCRGRPRYTSEPCIDELFANDTFSTEVRGKNYLKIF